MNVKLNRFDATNPFGSQKWTRLDDGRFSLDQEINPQLQQALDNQLAHVNQPAKHLNMMQHMGPAMEMFGAGIAQRAGFDELPGGEKAPMVTDAPMPELPPVEDDGSDTPQDSGRGGTGGQGRGGTSGGGGGGGATGRQDHDRHGSGGGGNSAAARDAAMDYAADAQRRRDEYMRQQGMTR